MILQVLVLGAGMMGSVIAFDLAESDEVSSVLMFDIDRDRLDACANEDETGKLEVMVHDMRDEELLVTRMREANIDVAVSALAHEFSPIALRAGIAAGTHVVDLVGSKPEAKLAMDAEATEAGAAIIPGFGFAPGLTNVLVGVGFQRLDQVQTAVARVGGLPLHPGPPLDYEVVYSMESTFNQYIRPAIVVRDGEKVKVDALTDHEILTFDEPVGECECFVTDGLGTLPFTLDCSGVQYMAEKTVRYPGHAAKLGTLIDCGLFETDPIRVDGVEVVPRRVLDEVLRPRIQSDDPRDVSVLRVEVSGVRDGEPMTYSFELLDVYDERAAMTSMARTTGFPVTAAVRMLLRGEITECGVLPPEIVFADERYEVLVKELKRRDLTIEETVSSEPSASR